LPEGDPRVWRDLDWKRVVGTWLGVKASARGIRGPRGLGRQRDAGAENQRLGRNPKSEAWAVRSAGSTFSLHHVLEGYKVDTERPMHSILA
jgi:hypothetical protein